MRYIVNSLLVALCIPQLLFANTFLGQLDQSSDKNTGDFNTGLLNANPIQERPPIPEYEFEGGKSFDGPIASTNEDTPTKAVEEKGPKALTSIKVGGSIPVGIIGEYEYLFAPDFGVSVFVEGGGIALSVPSSDSGDIDVMNLNGGIGFRKYLSNELSGIYIGAAYHFDFLSAESTSEGDFEGTAKGSATWAGPLVELGWDLALAMLTLGLRVRYGVGNFSYDTSFESYLGDLPVESESGSMPVATFDMKLGVRF